jgi:two-component system, NarL family, response regulator LiaR
MQVLIACHHPRARDTFRDTLRRADLSVIAAPPDGPATLELARRHHPDVVLLDDEFPGLGGVPGLQKLASESSESRVLILATHYEEGRGVRALLAGARGYIDRQISPAALPRIVHALMRGEPVIPRSMTKAIIELARREAGMRPVKSALTAREWEVLDLMTSGASTQEISNELVISLETVQSHIKHILRKLAVHSRNEAIAIAHELRHHRPESAGSERTSGH